MAYLIERWIVTVGLTTPLALRGVSILGGICTAFAAGRLSEVLLPGTQARTALLLATLPLYIRYATEARPYALALAMSMAATLLFWRMATNTSTLTIAAYVLTSVTAIYLQPFSFFVCCGHILFAVSRRRFVAAAGAVGITLALFLPWYFWARNGWSTAIQAESYQFPLSWRTPLLLAREISGGGFAVSLPLLSLAALGFWRGRLRRPRRTFLLCLTVVPVALGLAADAWSGYFVAARQFIFILPALAIAAADGMEVAAAQFTKFQSALLPVVLAIQIIVASRGLNGTRMENWIAAAASVQPLLPPDGCIFFVPPSARELYELVNTSLKGRSCQSDTASAAVAIVSPYANPRDLAEFKTQLTAAKSRVVRQVSVGRSTVSMIQPEESLAKAQCRHDK